MSLLFNFFRLELEVEPIFASMALYDAKERKKVKLAVVQIFRISFRRTSRMKTMIHDCLYEIVNAFTQ